MKAMILAAGRGARMLSLTDDLPKPLLPVRGKALIVHQIEALAKAAIKDIVINISYLAEKIQNALGDGSQFGVNIHYSYEAEALETGGGILRALPLLGKAPFLVLSSDIWTHYPFEQLKTALNKQFLAHLILVDNPSYHPLGDFVLDQEKISFAGSPKLTFASMGVYHPKLFENTTPGKIRLVELLKPAINTSQVSGEYYQGEWVNVGTKEEWQRLC